jgi:hypothetical protein
MRLEQAQWDMGHWSWKMIDEGLFLGLHFTMRTMTRTLLCRFRQIHPTCDSWGDLSESCEFAFDEHPQSRTDNPEVWCAAQSLGRNCTLLCVPLLNCRTKCILLGHQSPLLGDRSSRPEQFLDFDARYACAIESSICWQLPGRSQGWVVCSWNADIAVLNLGLEVVRKVRGTRIGIETLYIDKFSSQPVMVGCWEHKAWMVKVNPVGTNSLELQDALLCHSPTRLEPTSIPDRVCVKLWGMNVLVQLQGNACHAVAAFYDPTNFGSDPVAGLKTAFPSMTIPDNFAIATQPGIYAQNRATWISPDWVYLEENLFGFKDSSEQSSPCRWSRRFSLPLPENTAIWGSRMNPDLFWAVSTLYNGRTIVRRFQLRSSLTNRLDLSAVDAVTRSVIASIPDDETRKWFAATVASLLPTPYSLIYPDLTSQ